LWPGPEIHPAALIALSVEQASSPRVRVMGPTCGTRRRTVARQLTLSLQPVIHVATVLTIA
jgi:hypothetical protein